MLPPRDKAPIRTFDAIAAARSASWEVVSRLLRKESEPVAYQLTELPPLLAYLKEALAKDLGKRGGDPTGSAHDPDRTKLDQLGSRHRLTPHSVKGPGTGGRRRWSPAAIEARPASTVWSGQESAGAGVHEAIFDVTVSARDGLQTAGDAGTLPLS
ncbi:MAG: hypothetical protein ACRECF_08865 [Methyloceanibacter sp.]